MSEMANMFSAASKLTLASISARFFLLIIVDSGKTGYEIDRERIKSIRKMTGSSYPDFLMKNRSYPSQSILGILQASAWDGTTFKNFPSHPMELHNIQISFKKILRTSITSIKIIKCFIILSCINIHTLNYFLCFSQFYNLLNHFSINE